ncbi:TetR/AcrR family transcriptional regulator [Nesterenkonia muleiensis]|uniref:TetR/AcrR family transcriptional regulator n=1 Tax=Nesterenkonia muleiensis TaxID=2282648 RepID=UPI0013902D02|nr:TetR/AcrR family transcriptional regulator [Nesterenkonia muleiensis]
MSAQAQPTPDREEPRRGRPRSETAHQKVLEATSRLLAHTSYDSITVEGIAAEAGVGKQTIYRWWKNKAQVVLEAVLTGSAQLDLTPVQDTGDLRRDLHTWMRETIAECFQEEHIAMARSLITAGLEGLPTTAELIQQGGGWDSGALLNRLRAAAERGEIPADTEVEVAASALTDPLIFHIITGKVRTAEWGQELVNIVISGVAAPGDA